MAKLNPFTFQTEVYDWETDTIYWKNRYYDPSPGRFLSRDPIDESSFRQSYLKSLNVDERYWLQIQMPDGNEFALVQNDPVDSYDVNGLLDPGTCVKGTVIAAETAGGIAAAIAALPAEAIVLGVVIIGEGAVITYEVCHKPKCGTCKPCIPPAGTQAIKRTDYPPSKPHGPIPTPHSHIVQVNQSPYPACQCYWNNANAAVVPGVPLYRLCLCILIRLVAEDPLIDGPIQNRFSFCCP
jgi:RHS repeat-associated protein